MDLGNRSRQPVVESSPVSRPRVPCRVPAGNRANLDFLFSPARPAGEADRERREKSKLRPSRVYQPSRCQKTKTLAKFVETVCRRAVGCVVALGTKVDRRCCVPNPLVTPLYPPLKFRHLKLRNASCWEERKEKQNRPKARGIANRENAKSKIQESGEAGLGRTSGVRGTGLRLLSPTPALCGAVGTGPANLAEE
jgi:hypothetical protein